MEAVSVLLTCLFASFCAPDGTCSDTAPLTVTLDFGVDDQPVRLWTTANAAGRPAITQTLQPLPTSPSHPLHLLARTRADGALLLSVRADPASDTPSRATLRLHPDRRANPTSPDALVSEGPCTQSFATP